MKLGFATITPLAGMPYRTMRVCNPILEEEGGWARAFIHQDRYGDRVFPRDYDLNDPSLAECDVLILSSYMSAQQFPSVKNVATHYSTEPQRWLTRTPSREDSTVVAQYQWRFASDLDVLPNCIPIDDPMYLPEEKGQMGGKIVVVYSPTSRAKGGWAAKGYDQVVKAFRSLDRDLSDIAVFYILENRPHEEVMRAKRLADIVIDDCKTGSYHSSGLEGLSCGAATVTWLDNDTREALSRILSEEAMSTLPFELCPASRIEEFVASLVMNRDYTRKKGEESRRWIQKHYSERWQGQMWIQWHREFLSRQNR